jgi:photosynthetic reaction center H subunit
MTTGAITGYIDVAQLALYLFWIFFIGLVLYLQREGKREGYPLEAEGSSRMPVVGFPDMPEPKTFVRPHGGGTRTVPGVEQNGYELAARATSPYPGSPVHPTGNPMIDGVGPGAWAIRPDVPDLSHEGTPRIIPMRIAAGWSVNTRDPNPIGLPVLGADGAQGGTVVDVWIDQGEPQIRYLELESHGRRILLPITLARVGKSSVAVKSILGSQFANVPGLANADQVTLQEEDRITAYYGSGHLYATAARAEPVI